MDNKIYSTLNDEINKHFLQIYIERFVYVYGPLSFTEKYFWRAL